MSVNATAPKADGGAPHQSRLQLVYAAHQQLEDSVDTLHAYLAAAKKHAGKADGGDGGFSPWTGVAESAEKCTAMTARCLRLFAPARKVAHLKGMTTLTKLYGSAAAPQERVVAFLTAVTAAFDGALPPEAALSGGRCLHRLDPAAADDFLVDYIQQQLLHTPPPPPPPPPSSEADDAEKEKAAEAEKAFQLSSRACLGLDRTTAAFRAHLRGLLLLQIEAAAQAGHTAHTLATLGMAAVEASLSGPAVAELMRYEAVCWREAARQRELHDSAALASPTNTGARTAATASSAAVRSPSPSPSATASTTATATQAARQTGAAATTSSGSFGVSGWKWHAVRIAVLLLLAVVVRFASGPLARALKSALQVTHTAQTRRRTLTL